MIRRDGRENMDRHFYKLESVRRVLTPSPPAYGLYARENVDNCERPLSSILLGMNETFERAIWKKRMKEIYMYREIGKRKAYMYTTHFLC